MSYESGVAPDAVKLVAFDVYVAFLFLLADEPVGVFNDRFLVLIQTCPLFSMSSMLQPFHQFV